MKIETVNCLVGSRQSPEDQEFKLAVYKCGIPALPVTEVALLQAVNGTDSISHVSLAGEIDVSKEGEWKRLAAKYPKVIQFAYPSVAIPMPSRLDQLDLRPEQFDRTPPKDIAVLDDVPGPISRGQTLAIELDDMPTDRAELRRLIEAEGVHIKFGNFGVPALQAMLLDARKKKAAA